MESLLSLPIKYETDIEIMMDQIEVLNQSISLNPNDYSRLSSVVMELITNIVMSEAYGELNFGIEFSDDFAIDFTIRFAIDQDLYNMISRNLLLMQKKWIRSFGSVVKILESNDKIIISVTVRNLSVGRVIDAMGIEEIKNVLSMAEQESIVSKSRDDLVKDLKERSEKLRKAMDLVIELRRKNDEIAELYQVQADQKIQMELIKEADKLKTQFLANMSHELRTPLNAIIGYSELMEDGIMGELNEMQDDAITDILKSSRHLLRLINSILDISKIEAGKMEINKSPFNFPILVDSVLKQIKPLIDEKMLSMVLHVGKDVGEITGDEMRISQIMINLLSNAIKFSHKGGEIKIEANIIDSVLKVGVIDSGIGIKEDHIGLIFDEFKQADSTDKRSYQGTGLGLSLVKRLVQLHAGAIWVESKYGDGSKFYFTLPLE